MPFRRGIYIFGIAKLGNQANSRGDFAFSFRNNKHVRFRAIGLEVWCNECWSERRQRDGAFRHADPSGLRPRYGKTLQSHAATKSVFH